MSSEFAAVIDLELDGAGSLHHWIMPGGYVGSTRVDVDRTDCWLMARFAEMYDGDNGRRRLTKGDVLRDYSDWSMGPRLVSSSCLRWRLPEKILGKDILLSVIGGASTSTSEIRSGDGASSLLWPLDLGRNSQRCFGLPLLR